MLVKSKTLKSEIGAMYRDKYVPGNIVSMDQFIVKGLDHLSTGVGGEANHSMFHGVTFFMMLSQNTSLLRIGCVWEPKKLLLPKTNLKLDYRTLQWSL